MLSSKAIYLLGFSAQSEDTTYIEVSWPSEYGFDVPVLLEDVTNDLSSSTLPSFEVRNYRLSLLYETKVSGTRQIRVHFNSGQSEKIAVFVPPLNRVYENTIARGIGSRISSIKGGSEDYRYNVALPEPNVSTGTFSAVAMMPVKDPAKRFQYRGAWKSSSSAAVELSSDVLRTIGKDLGLPSDLDDTEQHCIFASVQGKGNELLNGEQVFGDAFEDNESGGVSFMFIYAKNLRPLPKGKFESFTVCAEVGSPEYYRTTGTDSDGTAIPDLYLNGTFPARFIPDACTTPADILTLRAFPEVELAGSDGTLTIEVLTNEANPGTGPSPENAYDISRLPSYPALSGLDFTFTLRLPTGANHVASGTQTGNTKVFSGLLNSRLPYLLTVEDDVTGAIATIPFVLSPPQDRVETDRATFSTHPTRIPTRNPIGSGTRFQPPPECPCNDGTSINTESWAGPVDPCGICFACDAHGNLTQGGDITGISMFTNNGSASIPELTVGGSDGKIIFNSSPTILSPDITSYLPTTYTLTLHSTTGAGNAAVGAAITTVNTHPVPDYTFLSLDTGWYVVNVKYTGLDCNSRFWFFVDAPSPEDVCWTDVTVSIDPCSGALNANVSSSGEVESYTYAVNGVPVDLPYQVQAGDHFLVKTTFIDEHCAVHIFEQTITEIDLICPDGTGLPVGCMDPSAVNFDPSAIIDSGLCQYGITGCIDPTATNFDPNALYGDDSCLYLCSEPVVSTITTTSNNITVNLITEQAVSITVENPLTGYLEVFEDNDPIPVDDGVYIVTVLTSLGCIEIHIVGVDTTPIYGCMDRLASNFAASANVPYQYWNIDAVGEVAGENCTYSIEGNPCVPAGLAQLIQDLQWCLRSKLNTYTNHLRTGLVSNCEMNGLRKASLILSLLKKNALECVFNCKDSGSPTYIDTVQGKPCSTKWGEGGPTGSELVYDDEVQYQYGDVVQFDDEIYTFTGSTPMTGIAPTEFNLENPWKICNEPNPMSGTNVIDPFLGFISDFCKDCHLPKNEPSPEGTIAPTPDSMGFDPMEIFGDQIDL